MLKCVKHVKISKKELVIKPNHSAFTKTITSWIFKKTFISNKYEY